MKLNGKTVTTPGILARHDDRILVDGKLLPSGAEPVYLAANKPVGIVTTLRDPQGRATVRDLLPRGTVRVFPVGRLDVQSSGLLLLTNDGELAARLTHPRYHVPRSYRVKVRGVPDARALVRMRQGMRLADGRTGPMEVVIEQALPTKSWLRATVYEGRTHLVRRLCEAVGHPVEKLQRVTIGPLKLGKLAPGRVRSLTAREIRALRAAAGLTRAAGADETGPPTVARTRVGARWRRRARPAAPARAW